MYIDHTNHIVSEISFFSKKTCTICTLLDSVLDGIGVGLCGGEVLVLDVGAVLGDHGLAGRDDEDAADSKTFCAIRTEKVRWSIFVIAPHPEAQFPLEDPPLSWHSEVVKQVPLRTIPDLNPARVSVKCSPRTQCFQTFS